MKRSVAASLVAVCALTAACSSPTPPASDPPPAAPPSPTVTPSRTEPIVVATLPLPATFDPADAVDRHTTTISGLLLRGLYHFDAKGKPVPEVASSIETDDDRVFRVTLAPGWRFTDGTPVTAESFVDAWSRAADPAHPRARRDLFAPIAGFVPMPAATPTPVRAGRSPRLPGLTVLGPTSFRITLSRPMPEFAERLAHPAFAPLPDRAFSDPKQFATHPVGNGPYVLEGAWSSAGPIRLRANPSYTASEGAQNTGVDFRPYADPRVAMADLRAGRLDLLDVIPSTELAGYRDEFGARAISQPIGQTVEVSFGSTGPWAGAPGLARRRALSMALDRDRYGRDVLAGTHTPATDLAAPVVEGHSRDMCGQVCTLAPDVAAPAYARAGDRATVTVAFARDTGDTELAGAICQDVRRNLRVPCNVKPYATTAALNAAVARGTETGPYLTRHRMDVALLSSFLDPRFISTALTEDAGFRSPTLDADLARASSTPDRAQRVARYQRAEVAVLAALPTIPLLDANATVVSSTNVDRVRIDVFGAPVVTTLVRPTKP